MSETAPPPAGWYPDPKPATPDNPGERWWNGSEWTVSTRTDDTTVFISGEPPADRTPRRPGRVLVGAVAAVVGMGVGSLVTYVAMDDSGQKTAATSRPFAGGGRSGGDGLNPFGGGNGGNGSGNSNGGSGNGGSGSGNGGSGSNLAADLVDGVSIPLLNGWTGGTTKDGYASVSYGTYTCAGSTGSGSNSTCSYAGANTGTLTTPVGDGVRSAAEADIAAAVKESYGDVTGHQVLQEKAVTVAGRSGYLVRWQVDAKVGNNGTVETVVFPNKAGNKLIALHLGFDVASKAPSLSVMDQIVSGVADFSGGSLSGGGQAPGTS